MTCEKMALRYICFCVIFYFVVHYHKINNSGKEEQKVKV